MMRIEYQRLGRYVALLLIMGVLSLIGASSTSALSNSFPDPADTEGNSAVWAYNGETRYVRETNSALRVWFPGPNGSVTITNANFCDSNSVDYIETEDGSWASYGNGTNVSRFHFYDGATENADRWGIKYGAGDGRCNDTKTINFSGLTRQQNGYYWVNLDVLYVANANAGYDGGMNGYRLNASGGAIIGVRGNNAGHGTTQEQTGGSLSYINYSAPFGSPCDMETGQWTRVELYDLDNVGGSGAQPAGGPNVKVRIYNITNSRYEDFEGPTGSTWSPNGDNALSVERFFARPGRKYRLEINDVYQNNTIQYGVPFEQIFRLGCDWSLDGWATIAGQTGTIDSRRDRDRMFRFGVDRSGGPAPNIHIVERWMSGNSGTQFNNAGNLYDFGPNWSDNYNFHVPANATPGTNYCMRVEYEPRSSNNNNWGNSNTVCVHVIEANVSAIIDQTPPETSYVEIGNTVTSDARISNTGTAQGDLQYNHQIWYEVDGLSGAADRTFNADDLQLEQTGWVNRSVNAGNSPVVHTYTRAVTNPPANASHVCSRLEIRRQAGDTSIISVAVASECTRIGKSPSFAVTSGNVRTGGNYGAGTCSVWKPGSVTTDDGLAHYFGIIAHNYSTISATPHHSYFRDAAVSLGYIDNVVSKQGGIGDGTNIELHFARGAGSPATSRGGGLFYGSSGSIPAAGTFPQANPVNTHCLTNLFEANRYPAAATPNNVTVNDTEELPAPVAGSNAVTYNICGNVANNLLVLTGPGGGELVLQPGQQYVVRVTQNGAGCNNFPVFVRINSNIRYTGTNAPIDRLPQFIFLAGTDGGSRVSIQVSNAVTRLDGIYANRGTNDDAATFLTCAQRANPANLVALRNITTGDCSNPLTVNGAVVLGGRLDLYRAAGHGNNTDTNPAEVFNLRPDTILGDYARDRSSAQLEIINQRELAPRF